MDCNNRPSNYPDTYAWEDIRKAQLHAHQKTRTDSLTCSPKDAKRCGAEMAPPDTEISSAQAEVWASTWPAFRRTTRSESVRFASMAVRVSGVSPRSARAWIAV